MATASRIVRPNTVYRVNVVVLPASPDLIIKAVITKGGGHQIASAAQVVDAGSSHDLFLKVRRTRIYISLIVCLVRDSLYC